MDKKHAATATAAPEEKPAALPPTTRQRVAERKRERILDAGQATFVQDGFTGASMDRIALEAAVSKPTLYRYFDNKDHLFAEILKRVSDRMLVPTEHPDGDGAGMEDTLRTVALTAADVVLSDDVIALQRLATAEFARFPDVTRGFFENGPKRAISGFGAMLQVFRDRGELAIPDMNMAAHHFWSLTVGMPHRTKLINPDWAMSRAALKKWIHAGVDAFLKLYAAQQAPAAATTPKKKAGAAARAR